MRNKPLRILANQQDPAPAAVGIANDRLLAAYRASLAEINALEPGTKSMSDEDLRSKAAGLRQRLDDGAKRRVQG